MIELGGGDTKYLRTLRASFKQSPYRASWVTGLVTGFLLAMTGFILIGPFLAFAAPLIVAVFLGARTAVKPQFAGHGAGAAAGAMARAGFPILIGTTLSWTAAIGVLLLTTESNYPDPVGEMVFSLLAGLFLGSVAYGVACGIAAITGAIRGRNNRPMPVLPAIYDS